MSSLGSLRILKIEVTALLSSVIFGNRDKMFSPTNSKLVLPVAKDYWQRRHTGSRATGDY